MAHKITSEDFFKRTHELYGDRFEYLSPYTKTSGILTIRCKLHNCTFRTSAYFHLYKNSGCPECAKESRRSKLRLSQDEVIEKAIQVHGNKYDYSEVGNFNNISAKVPIICFNHGIFRQTWRNHIYNRQGCPLCAGIKRLTTESFVNKATCVHGDKYDYTNVYYVNNRQKVEIVCKTCGNRFWQSPSNHLQGQGCPKCASKSTADKLRSSTEDFIKDAQKTHGDKYDYSKVQYADSKTKVCIICPEHGEFWQKPSSHISGRGCPKCKGEKIKKLICGVGVNDLYGKEVDTHIYNIWTGILRRCYDEKSYLKSPTYKGCSVCGEWLVFSNFQKWYKKNNRHNFAIDKDILVKGNKIYSPETCCFVPQRINNLILTSKKIRGKYNIGVTERNGKFEARISTSCNGKVKREHIGTFATQEEAFATYKERKEKYIKEIAQEYYNKGFIDKKVLNALLKYRIEESD